MGNNGEKFYATGRRKRAIAKVWIQSGSGKITVNSKEVKEYFMRDSLVMNVKQPLTCTNTTESYDINATVIGGGISGQAGAFRLGVSRALLVADSEHRAALKRGGFLTRDARVVERKKYGRPGARKRFQFSKR
ncbi:MAG: 30S ribosomal protein S9 [Nitrospina sp.]|jgi:small subunit ribosomal protein S9|nr:30S ribosomal protein S9 [Nitrospina sp.]MBT4128058.1 30S ribosomal protein S9 [Nitrospina sp.]MBT4258849.1 30S ribosomal protein S9 [Nitrospina sp.]MBT5257920.1 30S ribosomal protein S9 [Nitrospina sp.]MBT5968808.1 30S ribosomal protein S9 [Nitrospina sp.]|tara:strand:- start:8572 stop:8970 length:399 start_codon:yes stop_codon:yes gene_type:complete